MEALDQISATLALTMGLVWASGINLYATLLTLVFLPIRVILFLPQDLQIVADPTVMAAAGLMYFYRVFCR